MDVGDFECSEYGCWCQAGWTKYLTNRHITGRRWGHTPDKLPVHLGAESKASHSHTHLLASHACLCTTGENPRRRRERMQVPGLHLRLRGDSTTALPFHPAAFLVRRRERAQHFVARTCTASVVKEQQLSGKSTSRLCPGQPLIGESQSLAKDSLIGLCICEAAS